MELGRRTGASLDTASTEHKAFGLATVRCSSTSPIVLPSLHNPLMVHPKAIPWGCEAQAEGRQKEFHGYGQTVATRRARIERRRR